MTLVLVAHGTRDVAGIRAVDEIADRVRDRLAGARVEVAYADVRSPDVTAVLASIDAPAVVVPAFLASGYHVRVDVPAQVARSGHPNVQLTGPLGPVPPVVAAAHDRLVMAGWQPGDTVVLAAAGSSDPRARADVRRAAVLLSARIGAPVRTGYLAGPPGAGGLDEVVAACRRQRRRVALATWLLAPGLFHGRLVAAGADLVADPIGAHPRLVDLVVRRYQCPDGTAHARHTATCAGHAGLAGAVRNSGGNN
jgi:sirohydrochlorin ferrochelatase